MKKVLFIVHEYYPYGSAITNCIEPIIKEMQKQNIDITILTRRTKFSLKKFEIIDGINVYRINDWFNLSLDKINSSNIKIEKYFYRFILRTIGFYRNRIKKDSIGFFNLKRGIRKGNKIIKNNKQDTIISCSYPFSTHKIAYDLKQKNNINWVSYQFDPHTFNHTLNFNLINKRLHEEIKYFSKCDKIFLPKENFEENMKTKLCVLKDKYYPIDFALIKKIEYEDFSKNNEKIIFVFAGTFYENIRMPNNMLDFFKNINLNYELHLYYIAEKQIEDVLIDYQKILKDKLILHNNKSKKECDEALNNANIIINVGNNIANQTPSKVFELISLRKPIINFYSIKNDTSKKVLINYPLVYNIYQEYSKDVIKDFELFCKNNKYKKLSYEKIKENYKTSTEIAQEFINEVNKCNEK